MEINVHLGGSPAPLLLDVLINQVRLDCFWHGGQLA